MKKITLIIVFLFFCSLFVNSQVYMYSINEEEDSLEYMNDTIENSDIDTTAEKSSCKIPDCEDNWGAKDIKICKSCHLGGGVPPCIFAGFGCKSPAGRKSELTSPIFRNLRFNMLFNQTAIYDISGNNWLNKGPKIYSREDYGSKYYLSIGWRWDPDFSRVELALYGHIDHKGNDVTETGRFSVRLKKYITQAQIDMVDDPNTDDEIEGSIGWPIELVFSTKGYFVRAADRGVAIRRDFSKEDHPLPEPESGNLHPGKNGTKIRRGAYFGGNEKTPHAIYIWTNEWYADCEPTWWNETTYKGFAYSEWYDGETLTYFASEKIEFNPTSFWSDAGKMGYCKFNSGCNITLITPVLEPPYTIDPITGLINEFYGDIDVEVGAEVEHIPDNTGTNTGEKPTTYTCPDESKMLFCEGNSDTTDTTHYLPKEKPKPDSFNEIFESHPNPFDNSTQIIFSIEETTNVRLYITNIYGIEILELVNNELSKGIHNVNIKGSALASGIYYCILETKDHRKHIKLVKL